LFFLLKFLAITGRTKASRYYDKYKEQEDSDSGEFLKEYNGEDGMKMQMLREDRLAIAKRDEQVLDDRFFFVF
jgi:hypothetical protein